MKYLIAFACALAAASASNLLAGQYPGSQHLPVIGANGVPVDTPAVQQAAAEHLAHKVEAHVRNGDYVHPVHGHVPVSSAVYPIAPEPQYLAPIAGQYPGSQHLPVIGANGVPVDTPAVQQAAAEHLAHKVEAHVRNGDYVHPVHEHAPVVAPVSSAVYPIAPESQHLPVIGANGVPVDTPAVQQAAAEHLAHKVEAHVRNGDYVHPVHGYAPVSSAVYPIASESQNLAGHYPGPQHLPVIGANGVPVDTPAVQQAAAEHLAHKVEAHVRNGDYVHPVHEHAPVVAPVSSAVYPIAPESQHLPVIGANGVPVDTPAVQQAAAEHLAHKVEAHVRNGDYVHPVHGYAPVSSAVYPIASESQNLAGHYPGPQHLPVIGANGVPVDTPAVQQAAAEHFVHKVEAHVRNGDYVHGDAPVSSAVYPIAAGVAGVSHAGLPLDTAEVAAAKINHFAAHAKALTGYSATAYTYPYSHLYRARRGVVAPVAYHTYAHTPVVAQTYSSFPFNSGFHYRKRRGVVAPFAYTGYTHAPVVHSYSAFPYAHHY